jgi:DNA repair protein SbcC/Rad50
MSPSLSGVSISNFRSINGTITVPLNAPVILVHGPNGTGKTSVLSAIELALTGEILDMQRTDANYQSHLIHWGAENSRIILDGADLPTRSTMPHETIIRTDGIHGGALLSGEVERFFSERCYLAQATLGRLLEIYQNANPREESALTRFVKDLLGLDVLDALIEGLHPAADVRNTRRLSPGYTDAEAKIQAVEVRMMDNRKKLAQMLNDAREKRAAIRAILTNLLPLPDSILRTELPAEIEATLAGGDDDRKLIALNGHRRDLASLRQRALPLSAIQEGNDEASAVADEQAARAVADTWRSTTGKTIEVLIGELRGTFPDLPSVASTDPNTAFRTAAARIEAELQRCLRAIADDDAIIAQLEKLNQEVEQSRARVALADEQLMAITGEAEGLRRALASIIPHIHGDNCPVCGRDYHEVSSDPLVQHVSTQVARLAEQADRLQGLGLSRASAVSEQSKAERTWETAVGKRLSPEGRVALKARVSDLTEAKRRLTDVAASVDAGADAMRREAEAQRRLSEIRNRHRLAVELRASLADLCRTLEQPALDTSETISAAIQRLDTFVAAQEAVANDRLRRRRDASGQYQLLREQEAEIERLQNNLSSDDALKRRWESAFAIAEQHRQTAKTMARAVANARTEIVGRVFNSSLNKIWRDLFVRLAPTEPFVPAFRLPQTSTEPVTAQLETVHRQGGTGGAPGSMLSAGNLNTAALTLFLALHLSVRPQLPWLILDDPVQSMDEVHIAQFAALLRTLSKEHHRQIVISVHERPLFDYLTLELSPAFAGDQLITVELSRSNAGASIAEPTYHNWEPDRAVVAA